MLTRDRQPAANSKAPTQTHHTGRYAVIAIDRSHAAPHRELTYGMPEDVRAQVRIGVAVLVPFGKKIVTGYVVGFTDELEFEPSQLRKISGLASRGAIFEESSLRLARWMSAYYHAPLAECLACFMPQGWQSASRRKYELAASLSGNELVLTAEQTSTVSRSPRRREVLEILRQASGPLSAKEIKKQMSTPVTDSSLQALLSTLVSQGQANEIEEMATPDVKPLRVRAVRLKEDFSLSVENREKLMRGAPKQAAALRVLEELSARSQDPITVSTLDHQHNVDGAALKALEKKGWAEFYPVEQKRAPVKELPPPDVQRVKLTGEQRAAVAAIDDVLHETHENGDAKRIVLLQGVTASGKTEVYLHAIEKCLQQGRRALVLVPEIALTAQTVEVFQRRFQERVAIFHSALSAGERFDEWRRARAGQADIIVGARSAVFAPCRDLGLIIVDEEHDHSYKQDNMPRYHAREVAFRRAAFENAVVVLGSATPSLETYHRATRGDYVHLRLTKRVEGRNLPEVEIVDMTEEAKNGRVPVLSSRLQDEVCDAVARGEQAIIFLNRRGFSTYVQCTGCGHVERCTKCDVSLTFHRGAGELRCHHCDFVKPVPEVCPECDGFMLDFTGTGTEKVETELRDLLAKRDLAHVKTLRLDRDTTMAKGAHGKILGEFRQGKAQVLIGTQMVTKGLDFPHVTLVGVISADTALNVPDFRAAERTFQLLAQVAGRAGRGEKAGKVLIQTLSTDNYAILAARDQDFEQFVEQEMEHRQAPPYPPFSYIVNIISADEDAVTARERIQKLAARFEFLMMEEAGEGGFEPGMGCELLGPVECPVARVKNKYRFHLLLRDRNRPRLHRILAAYDGLPREARDGLTVDVDALTIL